MATKTITLKTKDAKTLVELLDRGLCYTDAYYRSFGRVERVYDEVLNQLKAQGAKEVSPGEIKFR